MWDDGSSRAEIAEALGVNVNTLTSAIQAHRDMFPMRKHHAADWARMLRTVEGMAASAAAAELGCSDDTVRYWRKRLDRRR